VQSGCPTDKFFEIKILTPKPLGLKILRGILAKPAPDKAFTGLRGRGTLPPARNSHFETSFGTRKKALNKAFFRGYPQAAR